MATPQKIGRYDVLRELGTGAMGSVVEARDPMMDRTVAIKTILASALMGPQANEYRDRFLREARAAGRLSHPGVVTVFDVGEHEGTPFLVMEYISGRTLDGALSAGERFSLEQIYSWGQQLAEALDYAHKNGVVHRDIKPANIMLTAAAGQPLDSLAKITDFGVAKLTAAQVTATGQLLGTPSFMPPEQFTGQPIDGRSDLFSLGVILYTLASGDKPFPGDTITAVSYKVVHTEPIHPRKLNPAIPAGFDAVIMKCLEKDPGARYQSGEALAKDFLALRDGRAVSAAPVSTGTVLSQTGSADNSATLPLDIPMEVATEGQTVPLVRAKQGVAAPVAPAQPPRSTVAVPPARAAQPAAKARPASRPAPEPKSNMWRWVLMALAAVVVLAVFAKRVLRPPASGPSATVSQQQPAGTVPTQPIPAPSTATSPTTTPSAEPAKTSAPESAAPTKKPEVSKADSAKRHAKTLKKVPMQIQVNRLPHAADLIIWDDDQILFQREGRREIGGAPLIAQAEVPEGHHSLRVVITISGAHEEAEKTVEGDFAATTPRVLNIAFQRSRAAEDSDSKPQKNKLRQRVNPPQFRLHVSLE